MKNKNVLIVTDYVAPYEGNFIMSLKKLEESIKKDGNSFYYIFSNKARNVAWIQNLNNVSFFSEEKNILKNKKILNKFIKNKKIDVVYSHFCLPKTQLSIKLAIMHNKKVKLVQHFHNHYELPHNFIKKIVFKFIFEGDLNIGCSEDVARSIPYLKDKVTYVTNAIEFSRLDIYDKIELAKKGNFVILMFGYTYERKGVDLAIKAISKLNNDNIVLAISVSKNPDEFKQCIIKDFGQIPSFVKILEPRNDIATYYKASDLFLSSAREEGFCYAIVESMYCGIPCICTKLPGQPNEIPDLITVESENVKQLTDKINDVLNHKNTFSKEKVQNYLVSVYGIDTWVENIKGVLYNAKK